MLPARTSSLSLVDQKVLWRAVNALERASLVGRLTELTGEPLTQIMRRMPKIISRQIHNVVHSALSQALEVALYKMDSGLPEPGATWCSS